jgi:hypothetical protein
MKNNSELQEDVQNAIQWEPLLDAAKTGVTACCFFNRCGGQLR